MSMERASWLIKDEAALDELVQLMNLGAAEATLLKELEPHARSHGPSLTKNFYDRLFAHPQTAEYLKDVSIDRLHGMVQQWFVGLFCGDYTADYARRRLRIGEIHVKIGLPVRYPLAMLDVIMPFGEQIAMESSQPEAAKAAFRKVLALDVAVFNQAYEDNQLRHLADLVGGERLARRLLAGN